MKKTYKVITLAMLLSLAVSAGCGSSEKVEREIQFRQQGIEQLQNGEYEASIDSFNLALEQQKGPLTSLDKDIYLYKAKAQIEAGNVQDAVDTYSALLESDKKYADAYYLRGCAYINMGDAENAVSDFAQAVSYQEVSLTLYADIYEQLSGAGLDEEARSYLEQGLLIEGENAKEQLLRGRLYVSNGDYGQAVTELEQALAQGETEANRYLANAYRLLGDNTKARVYYEAYNKAYPSDGDVLYEMGQMELSEGAYESALEYFTQGLADESAENRQGLWSGKIVAMEYTGDFTGAKMEMEAYLEQYPQDEEAAREYVFLKTR